MILDHYNAFKPLLARGILVGNVYDGVRVNGDKPVRANYASIMPVSPGVNDDRYTGLETADSTARFRWDVRFVGTSVAAVLRWQQEGRGNVMGEILTVPGRVCEPIKLVGAVEEARYRHDTAAGLFWADDTFELWSRRV